MKIAAVINFCTNDYRFLKKAIEETELFSHQVLVPVCDHFFDGTKENRNRLNQIYHDFPNTHFLEFAYDPDKLYTPYIQRISSDEDWGCLWHSTARYLSYLHLSSEIDYVLFLDTDEIIEGKRFKDWLKNTKREKADAYWFSSYCYGFEASKRAPHEQQTALLVKRSAISPLKVLNAQERFGIFGSVPGSKRLNIVGLNGNPMIHHYSWVRTNEEILKKITTWGKKHERNWGEWIQSKQREMKQYQNVTPYFDPLSIAIPDETIKAVHFQNVTKITPKLAFEKEVSAIL